MVWRHVEQVKFSGKQTLRQGLPARSLLRIHTHKGVRKLNWTEKELNAGAASSGGLCLPCLTRHLHRAKLRNPTGEGFPAPAPPGPAMDSTTKNETQPALLPVSSCPGPEWPEQQRAEQLARGAALKWASGIFYRPEQLVRLGQYRSREVQRTCSLEARMKSVVQSYLEGVKTGVWQLAQGLEAVQEAREALGQARGLLRGMAEAVQALEPLREQVSQHQQLQALSQLLPRLRAGEYAGVLRLSPTVNKHPSRGWGISGRLHGGTHQEPPRQ